MQRDYRAIQRVLIITLLLNLLATSVKLLVGFWTGALSLVADGLDTLFDGISNVVGLVAVRISSRPPDEDHPYGHRKFETLAALFIAVVLFVAAWELAVSAIERLIEPVAPIVNRWSILAVLFGAVVQCAAGVWELHQGRVLQSEVLVADARHTLATVGVSAAVLIGLVLVALGYPRVDPLVALLIAGFIAKIGIDTLRDNIPALVDSAPLAAGNIAEVVSSVEGVESFHHIRSRGPVDNVAVDLHVRVAPHLTIQDANAIADEVRRRLLDLPGVGDVTVHAEAERDPASNAGLYTATKLAAQELGVTVHEFWVQEIAQELSLHLHVGVDPNLTLHAAHDLVDRLERLVMERLPQVRSVRSHIELANLEVLPSAQVSRGYQERIAGLIEEATHHIPALSEPHDIQIRQVEGKLFISVEALVDGKLSVVEAHDLSTQLQEAIRANIPNVGEALVHLEPQEGEAAASWSGAARVCRRADASKTNPKH